MKRLGKLVIMPFVEYESLMCRCEDADAAAGDLAEELSRAYAKVALVEAARDNAIAVARRFHAAGGYSHTLPKVKEQLAHATTSLAHCIDLLVKWRPLVEALETYPNQFVEIGFDAGMHFPVKRWNPDGTEYLASVQYQDKQYPDHQTAGALSNLAHSDDVSDADAAADFDVVGTSVAAERRQS